MAPNAPTWIAERVFIFVADNYAACVISGLTGAALALGFMGL